MNSKSRATRAVVAVASLAMAGLMLADMAGHARAGAEYLYQIGFGIVAVEVTLAVVLFTWNVVTYKRR